MHTTVLSFRIRRRALRRAMRRRRERRTAATRAAGRAGLTLTETIVALALCTGALLTLAASGVVAIRLAGDARRDAAAVAAARARVEAGLSAPCASDSGAATLRRAEETARLGRDGGREVTIAGAAPC